MAGDHDSRAVAHGFGWMNLWPQAVEDRKPQCAVRRPFRVPQADNKLRPHPMDWLGHDRWRFEWGGLGGEGAKGFGDCMDGGVVVTTAACSARQQATILVIADAQRVKVLIASPADDHEVIRLDCFDLEPER